MKEFTKRAISETFTELLKTQTIEKITVKMIAETCGINRQTFYYHFSDIYELMEWTLDNELRKFTDEKGTADADWQTVLAQMFTFLRSHRKVLLNGYHTQNRFYYELFMYRHISPAVREHLESFDESKDVPSEKLDFLTKVFTRVLLNFILDWLDEGMPDEEKIGLNDYFTLLNGGFKSALYSFRVSDKPGLLPD